MSRPRASTDTFQSQNSLKRNDTGGLYCQQPLSTLKPNTGVGLQSTGCLVQSPRKLGNHSRSPPRKPRTPLLENIDVNRPFFIGVCGGTASGKTTVCDILHSSLGELTFFFGFAIIKPKTIIKTCRKVAAKIKLN